MLDWQGSAAPHLVAAWLFLRRANGAHNIAARFLCRWNLGGKDIAAPFSPDTSFGAIDFTKVFLIGGWGYPHEKTVSYL